MVVRLVINTLIAELLVCSSTGLCYATFGIILHYAKFLHLTLPPGMLVFLMTLLVNDVSVSLACQAS